MNSADSPPDAAPLPPDRQPDPIANSEAEIVQPRRISFWQALWTTEDWWANWVGAALLTACLLSVWLNKPVDVEQ